MGYSRQIAKGFSWAFILNGLAMVISIAKIVILSHFVFGPAEFGVFGVGILVLGILELLTETGINTFLIQETEPVKKYLNTAWAVSILRGIVIAAFLVAFSYPIAIFFKINNYSNFILAFSLVPFIRGFINPAIANLQKNLKFKQDAIYRFTISAIEDVSIITLSLLTHNIYSFVIGILIGVIIEVIITFVFIDEKPRFKFNKNDFNKIVNQGKWVSLAQIFDYLFERTDDIVVGRLLDVFSLGIYQNVYTISSLPENAIAQQLGKITFPVFVNMQNEKMRIKKAFWKSFVVVFAILAPFGLLMFLLADPAVHVLLGDRWLPAIPVLKILALFGITRALVNLFYPVFLSYKKQNYITAITLVSWIALLMFVIPLTQMYGITGAAASALIGSLVALPLCIYFFNELFE